MDCLARVGQSQAERAQVTSSPRSRMTTSPKSTSASRPGRCSCGIKVAAGSRPASIRIARRLVATYSRTIQYDTSVASCSSRSRSKIPFAVCCCFRGASRSCRGHPSITPRYGSSRDPRFGTGLRSFGHADSSAATTVRIPRRACAAAPGSTTPARASRRMAAYNSTRDRAVDIEHAWAAFAPTG